MALFLTRTHNRVSKIRIYKQHSGAIREREIPLEFTFIIQLYLKEHVLALYLALKSFYSSAARERVVKIFQKSASSKKSRPMSKQAPHFYYPNFFANTRVLLLSAPRRVSRWKQNFHPIQYNVSQPQRPTQSIRRMQNREKVIPAECTPPSQNSAAI